MKQAIVIFAHAFFITLIVFAIGGLIGWFLEPTLSDIFHGMEGIG